MYHDSGTEFMKVKCLFRTRVLRLSIKTRRAASRCVLLLYKIHKEERVVRGTGHVDHDRQTDRQTDGQENMLESHRYADVSRAHGLPMCHVRTDYRCVTCAWTTDVSHAHGLPMCHVRTDYRCVTCARTTDVSHAHGLPMCATCISSAHRRLSQNTCTKHRGTETGRQTYRQTETQDQHEHADRETASCACSVPLTEVSLATGNRDSTHTCMHD